MTAAVHNLGLLFVFLAIVAFAVAIWRASARDVLGALLAAFIGVVILVLTN